MYENEQQWFMALLDLLYDIPDEYYDTINSTINNAAIQNSGISGIEDLRQFVKDILDVTVYEYKG